MLKKMVWELAHMLLVISETYQHAFFWEREITIMQHEMQYVNYLKKRPMGIFVYSTFYQCTKRKTEC